MKNSYKRILILSVVILSKNNFAHEHSSFVREVVECREVPREFRHAEHPYAQAPDGCSGIESPREVRDSWGPVNFKPVCNDHDKCYYTVGSNWKTCNDDFRKRLMKACWNGLRTRVRIGGFTRYLPPDPARLALCEGIAVSYYTAVQAGVAFNIYKDAQRLQRAYNAWFVRCH